MTIRDWFIAPPPERTVPPKPHDDRGSWQPPAVGHGPASDPPHGGDAPSWDSRSRRHAPSWAPPGGDRAPSWDSPGRESTPSRALPGREDAGSWAPPRAEDATSADSPRRRDAVSWARPGSEDVGSCVLSAGDEEGPAPSGHGGDGAAPREALGGATDVACAAVLGQGADAEAWAAALALALVRGAGERAGTVVVVIDGAPDETVPPGGGLPASRRLAARLRTHGFAPVERGRLAWVRLDAADVPAARRAVRIGAPAVLAVTAPLTAALEHLIAELDLAVLVTSQPDGPLAELAVETMAAHDLPLVSVCPLARGPARALAFRGLAAPRLPCEIVAAHRSPG